MGFPTEPEQLTAPWLSEQLGTQVRSFEMEQIGVGVGILGRLYRLTLEGDGPATVVAKFPTLDEGAREHVVRPLNAYQREAGFYRDLSAATTLSVPAVFAAEIDEATGDFVLLLEDVGHLRMADQVQGCSVADAEIVLDGLAQHHARFLDPATHDLPWMMGISDPVFGAVIGGMTGQALPEFLRGFAGQFSADLLPFFEGLPAAVPQAMATLDEANRTYAHVDLRLDNIFFGDADRPVVVLDWQLAAVTGLAYDVAYFLSQSMDTETRRRSERTLVDRYLASIEDLGITVDRGAFETDYRRTVAFCSIYPVIAGGQIDLANDRAVELVEGMLSRSLAAIEDHKALEVWPT